jgi:hypothetical protein
MHGLHAYIYIYIYTHNLCMGCMHQIFSEFFYYESVRTLPFHQKHRSTSVCGPIELKIGIYVNNT